jgi:hypothetical protein
MHGSSVIANCHSGVFEIHPPGAWLYLIMMFNSSVDFYCLANTFCEELKEIANPCTLVTGIRNIIVNNNGIFTSVNNNVGYIDHCGCQKLRRPTQRRRLVCLVRLYFHTARCVHSIRQLNTTMIYPYVLSY